MPSPVIFSDKNSQSLEPLLSPASSTTSEQLPIPAHSKRSSPPRCSRTRAGRACAALVLVGLTLLGTSYLALTMRGVGLVRVGQHGSTTSATPHDDFTDNSRLLRGHNATARFRDNLSSSPDDKYITAWPSSGWTNDVMAAINLIYLAKMTGRTPVLPPFTPSHVGSIVEVGPLTFSDIFDIPRLSNEIGMHILEWHQMKTSAVDTSGPSEVEKLGCWSAWSLNVPAGNKPRYSEAPRLYNLDISYTPVPDSFTLSGGLKKDQYFTSLWSLASLGFPESRNYFLTRQGSKTLPTTSGTGEKLEPDDKMLCFDLLYYVGLANEEEWAMDYAPYWKTVGTHMYWAPKLLELAEGYLRRHFGVQAGEPIPPFVSVHVRRADFAGWCPPNMNREACFAPSTAYARRVQEIQDALRARPDSVNARAVLVTSDERDPGWWEEIAELGPEWGWVDHAAEKTVEKYGKWYPVVLDAVFQSLGVGFVGTDHSTMTLLSQRRVGDWNGGLSEKVRWGTPGADDH
ncbi:hypothetical protein BDV93DRAFT_517351 [Ceratobasidium sp. AG-I]|nr:hypothetical protein BDV93DRAFT_517351 [Ceratobasidium sp. AG-I]